jgi:hypothetical protein
MPELRHSLSVSSLHVLVAACVLVACGGERAATPDASDASVCTSSTPSLCMADSSCYAMCPPTWSARPLLGM